MNPEKMTTQLQSVLMEAQSIALGYEHQMLDALHLLAALLKSDTSIPFILEECQIDGHAIQNDTKKELDQLPQVTVSGNQTAKLHPTNDFVKLFQETEKLAKAQKDNFMSSEICLLAVMKISGAATNTLKKHTSEQQLLSAIEKLRGGDQVKDASAENQRQASSCRSKRNR